MKDESFLRLACLRLGITEEQVMSWRVYDDHIALVIWPGPKHKIRLNGLVQAEATLAAVALAQRHGVDLRGIVGSGVGGRVLLHDVKKIIGG